MKWLFLLHLALTLRYCKAEVGNAYHGPAQARELFAFNNRQYYFYSDRVSWDEANAICEAGNMHLTLLDTPAKAKWAAECISTAWMVFEDMWIGARKGDLGHWYWQFDHKIIPEEPAQIGDFNYMYPPWIDSMVPSRDGKDCLAVDRNGHDDPYFVDLDCSSPRPFICEESTKTNKSEPWPGSVVTVGVLQYILYHGRLSWSSAVSYCRQQGYALATIENMATARKIAKAMLKARPEFEDAWIGASYKDDKWIWVETGSQVKTIPAKLKNQSRPNTPDNVLVPQYPPWFEQNNRHFKECAIFDRHLCDEPTFIDLKCNRQRDFICISHKDEGEPKVNTIIIDRGTKRYLFYPVQATWIEGNRICEAEGANTTMLVLTDADETKFIMQAMADARNPMDHIWLGGTIVNGIWVWFPGAEPEGAIPLTPDDEGFPPWCDNETSTEMGCLNLDRQNHWTPLIYGLECNTSQAVVCVQPIEKTDSIIKYVGSGEKNPSIELKMTRLVNHPISSDEATLHCRHDIGKVWHPLFEVKGIAGSLKKFYAALKAAINGSSDIEVYHVDGGKYSAQRSTWVHQIGRQAITYNITTVWDPHDGDCLVGQINKTANDWTWYPVKCYHQLYSQVICHPDCVLSEVPYEDENPEWLCNAPPAEIFDHKMIGMDCDHRCPPGNVLQGPEKYYCTRKGWHSKENAPVEASKCRSAKNGLDFLQNKNVYQDVESLTFIVDSTGGNSDDYLITKYMIGVLADHFNNKNPNLKINIISMESGTLNFNEETIQIKVKNLPVDNCNLLKSEIKSLVQSGEGLRDFAGALMAAKQLVSSTHSAIIFIVPDSNQKGPFSGVATELNAIIKTIAIGTTKNAPSNQLAQIGSTINSTKLSVRFKTHQQVLAAVRQLHNNCTKCKCKKEIESIMNETEEVDNGSGDKGVTDNAAKRGDTVIPVTATAADETTSPAAAHETAAGGTTPAAAADEAAATPTPAA